MAVLNAVVRVCFEAVPVMVINTVAETSPVIVSIIVFATVPGKVVTRVAAAPADSQRETIPPTAFQPRIPQSLVLLTLRPIRQQEVWVQVLGRRGVGPPAGVSRVWLLRKVARKLTGGQHAAGEVPLLQLGNAQAGLPMLMRPRLTLS
jgi:hypothetical protein